jgi:hypothetical protein
METENERLELTCPSFCAHRHTLPGEFPDPAPEPGTVTNGTGVTNDAALTRTSTAASLAAAWGGRTKSLVRRVSTSKLTKAPPTSAAVANGAPAGAPESSGPHSGSSLAGHAACPPSPPPPPPPPVSPELQAALTHLSQTAAAHGTTSHAVRLRWLAYHSLLLVDPTAASSSSGSSGDGDAIVLSPRSWEELEDSVVAVARGPLLEAEVLRAVEAVVAARAGVAAVAGGAAAAKKTTAAGPLEKKEGKEMNVENGGHLERERGRLTGR